MYPVRIFYPMLVAVTALVCALSAGAQQTLLQEIRGHNGAMADIQPSWIGPLIQSDSRLTQGMRLSFSEASAPGARIFNYGNNHGFGLIAGRRFQFDFNPPSFFRNHSAGTRDGFGNASAQIKVRIASGNSEHGNFSVAAMLAEGFGGGYAQNGMLTSYSCPKVGVGKAFHRFDVQTVVSGVLPSGKVAQQGRVIEVNGTAQFHATPHTWLAVEDNSAFIFGSPADGQKQNFITPAAFYIIRRKSWEPTHPVFVVNGGEQIATSRFHMYNHNVIAEVRMLY